MRLNIVRRGFINEKTKKTQNQRSSHSALTLCINRATRSYEYFAYIRCVTCIVECMLFCLQFNAWQKHEHEMCRQWAIKHCVQWNTAANKPWHEAHNTESSTKKGWIRTKSTAKRPKDERSYRTKTITNAIRWQPIYWQNYGFSAEAHTRTEREKIAHMRTACFYIYNNWQQIGV